MTDLNKDIKIVLLVIGGFLLTGFLIFVGFNVNYKPIELKSELPNVITIEKAEATKVQARVYGRIRNTEENDFNGKYIKVSLFNANNENISTEYLKIENLGKDENKLFRATFNAEKAKSYSVDLVDNNENRQNNNNK